ncbi:MAG: hypothetical protein ACRELV_04115 [Longimicrobiales bacterium]
MRGGAGDDDVRPESPHLEWLREAIVQRVERRLADEQQREGIGETDAVARLGVVRVNLP